MAISKVGLTTGVTGTLPAANGGTGATSFDAAGLVLLSTTTLTSASSVTINPPFSSTYKSYRIIINGISPATSNSDLHCRFIKSDGTEETGYNYRWTIGGYQGGTDSATGSENADSFQFGRAVHNDSGTVNADILISNPTASTIKSKLFFEISLSSGFRTFALKLSLHTFNLLSLISERKIFLQFSAIFLCSFWVPWADLKWM